MKSQQALEDAAFLLIDLYADGRIDTPSQRETAIIERVLALSGEPRRKPSAYPVGRTECTGERKPKPASRPIYRHHMYDIMANIGIGALDARDKCLLTLFFAIHPKPHVAVEFKVEDIRIGSKGFTIQHELLRQPLAVWSDDAIICPLEALKKWLAISGIKTGNLLRSVSRHGGVGKSISVEGVSNVVRARLAQAGLSHDGYSANSFRKSCERVQGIGEFIPRAKLLEATGEAQFSGGSGEYPYISHA